MIRAVEDCTLSVSLLRHPRASRRAIAGFRDARLRALVQHAYRSVPYYRQLFDAHGVDPRAIRTATDLAHLPRTAKRDLHTRPVADVVGAGANPASLVTRMTGGSTGEPLVVRRSRREERLLSVVRRRVSRYYGYGPRDLVVVISAPRHGDAAPARGWVASISRRLGLLQTRHVSCLGPVEQIAERLRQLRPAVLGGYPSVLARVGEAVTASGGFAVRPRVVITGGEVRTPAMRDRIAAAFDAPVYDTYASHEFNRIANECRETGAYHVSDDTVLLEVLDEDGQPVAEGERGEVVATALLSRTMPFIRYRLGDIVVKGTETCACGAPFSTIRAIEGRVVDYFALPDGRLLHPYELVAATVRAYLAVVPEASRGERPFPWLAEYRYVQEYRDHIRVHLVARATPPPVQLEAMERSLRDVLGPAVRLDLVFEREMQADANGKFRVYRSLVQERSETGRMPLPPGGVRVAAG